MDRKAIAERLRALASDDKKRSKAARLRDVIDDVEAALAAGVSRASVVEELSKHGLEMTLATFETTLKRIRQKRGKASITAAKSASPPGQPLKPRTAAPVVEAEPEAESSGGSHNPGAGQDHREQARPRSISQTRKKDQKMKVAVLNFSGNVGKTTVAGHLLKPRMSDAPIYSIESINTGADADGLDVEEDARQEVRELVGQLMPLETQPSWTWRPTSKTS